MQPRRPHGQRAPSTFTTTWPISPAAPRPEPRLAVEHDPAADAGAPEDAEQRVVAAARAELASASVATWTSLPSATGVPRPRASCSASGKRPAQSGRLLRAGDRARVRRRPSPGEPTPTRAQRRRLQAGRRGGLAQRGGHRRGDVGRAAVVGVGRRACPSTVWSLVDDDGLDLRAAEVDAAAGARGRHHAATVSSRSTQRQMTSTA